MRRAKDTETSGWGMALVVFPAALVVLIPIFACFYLPQIDIPGRIDWALRRGSLGPTVSLVPNDYSSTGALTTIFFCLNVCLIILTAVAFEGHARVRSGGRARPGRYWAALAGAVVLYGLLSAGAVNEYAAVGPGGFGSRAFGSGLVIHRWPEVLEIRRLHVPHYEPSRQIDSSGFTRTSGDQCLRYKLIFADGTRWESATSENWAWGIIRSAMRRASKLSHVTIKDYRQR